MDQSNEQAVRERAYLLWQKEGSPLGKDEFFWQRAVLMQQASLKPPIITPLQADPEDDARVEEALAESFPASDPPSFTPETRTKADRET